MSLLSAAILLCLVMDPFGNTPIFLYLLKKFPLRQRQTTILRELLIALAVLVAFLIFGRHLLAILSISEPAMRISGGIILFMIAIRMVFGEPASIFQGAGDEEPLIVPLAIPCIAGPSAITTVMLLAGQEPARLVEWLVALLLAWSVTCGILLLSSQLDRLIGKRGLSAMQSLMGLILTAVAVEMFLQGLRSVFQVGK